MRTVLLLITGAVVLSLASAGIGAQGRGQAAAQLPDGAGRELVAARCGSCHGLNLITNSWGNTREGWRSLFSSMVSLPGNDADAIAGYLAAHFR